MSNRYPKEVDVRGVYMPPLLVSVILGLVGAWLTMRWLDHSRLTRYFPWPMVAFLAFTTVYSILISTLLFPS